MRAAFALLLAMWLAIFALAATNKRSPVEEPTANETQVADVVTAIPLVTQIENTVTLYDVPLDEELQLYIIRECESRNVAPAIVFAMIYKESGYNANAIGDGGDSFGLMQIQPRWWSDLMAELGCDDLLIPYQNVTVGISIVADKIAAYDTVGEALTAYNAGDYGANEYYFSKGIYANGYAETIMAYAEELDAR